MGRKRNFCEQKGREDKAKSLDGHCHEFNNPVTVRHSHSHLPEDGSLDGFSPLLLALP